MDPLLPPLCQGPENLHPDPACHLLLCGPQPRVALAFEGVCEEAKEEYIGTVMRNSDLGGHEWLRRPRVMYMSCLAASVPQGRVERQQETSQPSLQHLLCASRHQGRASDPRSLLPRFSLQTALVLGSSVFPAEDEQLEE